MGIGGAADGRAAERVYEEFLFYCKRLRSNEIKVRHGEGGKDKASVKLQHLASHCWFPFHQPTVDQADGLLIVYSTLDHRTYEAARATFEKFHEKTRGSHSIVIAGLACADEAMQSELRQVADAEIAELGQQCMCPSLVFRYSSTEKGNVAVCMQQVRARIALCQ